MEGSSHTPKDDKRLKWKRLKNRRKCSMRTEDKEKTRKVMPVKMQPSKKSRTVFKDTFNTKPTLLKLNKIMSEGESDDSPGIGHDDRKQTFTRSSCDGQNRSSDGYVTDKVFGRQERPVGAKTKFSYFFLEKTKIRSSLGNKNNNLQQK